MVYVTKRLTFSASHRLFNPNLSDEENLLLFDKCSNPNGHGHNYVLEVTVAGHAKEKTGYVIDLKEIKRIVSEEIISKVDHKYLNLDVDFLEGVIPTCENIVKQFLSAEGGLEHKIVHGKLYSIRLHETENNFVEYRGE